MTTERDTLLAHARESIRRGSKSFAFASRLFDIETRERVWLLYAWCRACDDIADNQDHGGRSNPGSHPEPRADKRLASIRMLTSRALAGESTCLPAFDALGLLKRETGITAAMADDVIAGFALDATDWRPQQEIDLLRYCYHVAGAVGVMMAVVMGVSPRDDDTLDRACDLGIAFQLANIARDIAEDHAAGRCYLPADWLESAGLSERELIESGNRDAVAALIGRLCELEKEYEASARAGTRKLRFRQRWAVLSAAGIYGAIARKAERQGAATLDRRIVVGRVAKLGFVLKGFALALVPARRCPPIDISRRELANLALG